MKMKPGNLPIAIELAVLLGFLTLPATAVDVTVSGRQIFVGGAPFQVRGVCYAPTPINEAGSQPPYGDYFTTNYQSLYARDLPRMRRMGVNCLRVYGWTPAADHSDFLNAAYNGGQRPIYVLLNRWVNPATDWSDTNAVNLIIADWVTLVTNVMHQPAVLGYLIGNEVEWSNGNRTNLAFWAAMNRIAGAIRQYDTNHLISTTLADDGNLPAIIGPVNSMMTNFNVWCVQSYRGSSFGSLFSGYAGASGKPLLVTEFGMDAYDRRISAEYADNAALQAQFVVSLWNGIVANAAVVSGGCVFEWTDEWWKAGTPAEHNAGGWANAAFPDGWADEEWWGINRISPGQTGAPDVLQPRAVYDQLRALWTAQLTAAPVSPGQIQLRVQGASGQTAVLQTTANLRATNWSAIATNVVPFTNTVPVGKDGRLFFRAELR